MARFGWSFRARIGLSAGANHGVFALTSAALSLALALPIGLNPLPAAGQEVDRRFSFTGTFRYEPVGAPTMNALHLPPEAVPIPVASQSRRNASLLTPLPNVVPRALLGTRAKQPRQPFTTDNRSTLGVSEPTTRRPATPNALPGIERGEQRNEQQAHGRGDTARSAALPQDEPGSARTSDRVLSLREPDASSGPATNESSTATAEPYSSRTDTSVTSPSRRSSTVRGPVMASDAPKTNSILAPTPPWAERAFSGSN